MDKKNLIITIIILAFMILGSYFLLVQKPSSDQPVKEQKINSENYETTVEHTQLIGSLPKIISFQD